jgi:hypothetical protein
MTDEIPTKIFDPQQAQLEKLIVTFQELITLLNVLLEEKEQPVMEDAMNELASNIRILVQWIDTVMGKSNALEKEMDQMPGAVRAFTREYPKHITQSVQLLNLILENQNLILANQETLLHALRLPNATE